ncbi:hypothetical protein ACFU53_30350 [Streptomyces sp. NPDC057474]|uniref:hypothetical protein n=1 Tax=Streptomyces sp. NPDC057474 TaxID=3346144 RepID=UPI0036CAF280
MRRARGDLAGAYGTGLLRQQAWCFPTGPTMSTPSGSGGAAGGRRRVVAAGEK